MSSLPCSPARPQRQTSPAEPGGRAPAAPGPASAGAPPHPQARPLHARYLLVLTWAFTLFSSARLVSYLPTLWAIHCSGDSSQHSLWTWATWVGSNAAMAAWLFEHNHRHFNKAIVVTVGNSVMCLGTCILIIWYR